MFLLSLSSIIKFHLSLNPRLPLLLFSMQQGTLFFCTKWSKFGNSDLIYDFQKPSENAVVTLLFGWFPKNNCTKFDLNWSNDSREI